MELIFLAGYRNSLAFRMNSEHILYQPEDLEGNFVTSANLISNRLSRQVGFSSTDVQPQ